MLLVASNLQRSLGLIQPAHTYQPAKASAICRVWETRRLKIQTLAAHRMDTSSKGPL